MKEGETVTGEDYGALFAADFAVVFEAARERFGKERACSRVAAEMCDWMVNELLEYGHTAAVTFEWLTPHSLRFIATPRIKQVAFVHAVRL